MHLYLTLTMRLLAVIVTCTFFLIGNAQQLLEQSFVRYEARDERGSWTGSAPIEALSLELDREHIANSKLSLSLRPGRFDSNNFVRDANARRAVFETHLYPQIRFETERINTPQRRLSDGEALSLTLVGTLELHGITREISIPTTVILNGETLRAEGAFRLKLSDYDMTRPSFLGISVEDIIHVNFVAEVLLEP